MPKIVDHKKQRQQIIDATLKVVGEKGLVGVTAKNIATYSKFNEAYIYRYFGNLQDLLLQTFMDCDQKLVEILGDNLDIFIKNEDSLKVRFELYFNECWKHLSDNNPCSIFYFQYYHSKEFIDLALNNHRILLANLFVKVRPYFKREVNSETTLNLVLIGLISAALIVNEGLIINGDESKKMICNSLYQVLIPQLDEKMLARLDKDIASQVLTLKLAK